ncbi:MarR family winged helix-turn-helix transcriptional regulator [Desulfitobacterium metallireducens]|uniref:Transcriptional regulator n=1 Tax=Desulfitobacterium metallireducens DSM 15288 TaxID=871968 RepID=W0EEP1_9FIRM|nr:MarR family transcriptional regulator [Desulfitobacterium metallireducens]AHF07993.1 transcriptional regulator [Desulfitobacterium metallireducens DSM 15288]
MEKLQELSEGLEKAIRRAHTNMYRRGRSLFSKTGISDSQFSVLLALEELGPLTMGELCKQIFTACSTATDLANRLERDELVERIKDDKDHRVVRMHLLPKGKKIVQDYIQERQHFLEAVLEESPSNEYIALLETLEGFAERMDISENKSLSAD